MAAMILGSVLFMIWTASFWYVQDIEVRGSSPHTEAFVKQFLDQRQITGKHLLAFNPIELKAEALKNPLVKDIHFERELLPTRLLVKVQERKPAYRVFQSNSQPRQSWIVDLEGIVLPLPPESLETQELEVQMSPKLVHERIPEAQLRLIRQLESLQKSGKLDKIDGVFDLSEAKNLILYQRNPQLTIWLGRPEDLNIKLRLITPTYETAQKQNQNIQYIDLRFWQHPVVKSH